MESQQVHVYDGIPHFIGVSFHRKDGTLETGVVDQHIGSMKVVNHPIDGSLAAISLGDIHMIE